MDLEERTATPEELVELHLRMSGAGHGAHGSTASDTVAAADGYVCPQHPQVRSDKPGRCPIDGTFLEKSGAGSLPTETGR